jgi:hypothetical protein
MFSSQGGKYREAYPWALLPLHSSKLHKLFDVTFPLATRLAKKNEARTTTDRSMSHTHLSTKPFQCELDL